MYPQIACKRGSIIVTLAAFVWLLSTVRLCWENNLAQNWNFSCCSAANTWGQFTLTTETSAAQYAQRQILFLCGKDTCPAKNYNKDDLWKFSSISFSCTAIFKNKMLQKIATKTTFGNRFVCFSTACFQMCLRKRMQSHISCICLTFNCHTICSAIPAKNWNSSCSSAAILFPVRQIHEDNLHWQQKRLLRKMFSGKSCSCAKNTHVLQRITTETTFGSLAAFPSPARQYISTKSLKICNKDYFWKPVCMFLHCTFSRRLHKRMQSHISCIYLTFNCHTICSGTIPAKHCQRHKGTRVLVS